MRAPSTGLRWGLIGASDIAATRMIPAMRALGHSVTALCSSSALRATVWAGAHGVPHTTTSAEELLARDDIDAVYISTTNDLHLPHTLAAAAAGKHVLCEKPLALALADAWSMVEACRTAGVVLGVNHHLPGAATHRRIRELVAAGAVGRPLAARVSHAVALPERLRGWRLRDPGAGAGVVLDITCHDASVTNALFGTPVEATALAVRQGSWEAAAEDAAMSVIRYGDGVLAQTHDAFTVAHARTGLEVHGTDGSITAVDVMTQNPVGTVHLHDAAGSREIDVPGRRDLYEVVLEDLARAVCGAGEPTVTGTQGVHALAVALAVQEAARTGRTTPVDLAPATAH
ncbi:Gfo/Idh/MocA family protein [Streptomyces sp. NPDC048825]|uniref:Gfo/Idh/MocA family protein n=1 Tax=Streptomyces sp. NPDC048825 TaxID=3365592 RepID=UPI003711122B